jgi:hypothetical protein
MNRPKREASIPLGSDFEDGPEPGSRIISLTVGGVIHSYAVLSHPSLPVIWRPAPPPWRPHA